MLKVTRRRRGGEGGGDTREKLDERIVGQYSVSRGIFGLFSFSETCFVEDCNDRENEKFQFLCEKSGTTSRDYQKVSVTQSVYTLPQPILLVI